MSVDLHCHSTASDGRCPPAAVAARAVERGLTALALTDHDTFGGLAEAAAVPGIRFVPGVELSTEHRGRGLHLLAYFPAMDRWGAEMAPRLDERLAGRRERLLKMAAALARLGVTLDVDAVAASHGAITRAHVARQLVAQGAAGSMQEVFERWLGDGRPAFVPSDRWPTEEAIGFVRDQGGLTSLAHPGVDDVGGPELATLARAGLQGVEVWHPSHPRQTRRRLRRAARELKLVMTGGSDWHGGPGSDLLGPTIGDGLAPEIGQAFLGALDAL